MNDKTKSANAGLLQRRLNSVSSNILRYFGSVPGFAREAGYADGESLVSIGNGLLWISCDLAQASQPEQPVGEPAQTKRNLSRQFQEVGIAEQCCREQGRMK